MRKLLVLLIPVLLTVAAVGCSGTEEVVSTTAPASGTHTATASSTPSTTATAPTSGTPTPTATAVSSPTPHSISATPGPVRYDDSDYGYSYDVPSGWFVTGGSRGYSVVTSYYPGGATTPGDVSGLLLKAEFYVYSNDQALNLQTWIDQNTSGADVQSVSQRTIAGNLATVRSVTLAAFGGDPATQFFFEDHNRVFAVFAYTSNAGLLSMLSALLDSFEVAPK